MRIVMVMIPDLFLQLEKADGTTSYFETGDENKSNWMMFVRPAATFAEQNLVAYQHGQDIYFTVIKNIEPRQELKVLRMSCLKVSSRDSSVVECQTHDRKATSLSPGMSGGRIFFSGVNFLC